MERTDLMVREGSKRLRLGRPSRHRPDGESRQLRDDRMLWKGNALMRFAVYPTINSVLSNVSELRRQSRHVFAVPMGNRPPMTCLDVSSEHTNLNECCENSPGGTPCTPPSRGPEIASLKTDLQLKSNDAVDGRLTSPAMERTELIVGEGANHLRAGRLSRHRPHGECRRMADYRMLWKWTNLMRFATFPTINSVFSNAAELRR
jgi:hypothetical protein